MRTVRAKVIAAVLAIFLLSAGCARPVTTTKATSEPTTTPTLTQAPTTTATPTGAYGELRFALSTFAKEVLNPIKADSTTARDLISPMFDNMLGAQERELAATQVVERWELDPGALSWTYYIRKGIKFQDGSELTAHDIKFSLDGYVSAEAFVRSLSGMIDHVDVLDDYTVRIYTKGTQPDFPWYTSTVTNVSGYVGSVLPKNYIEQNGMAYFERHPMGSGSWRFIRHIPGDTLEYQAVEKHWRQTPEFKKLTLILIPEETTRVASLKTGAVDGIDVSLESAHELEIAGFKTNALDGYSSEIILHGAFQPGAGPIADVRVRQALSLAINRQEINDTLLYGKGSPPGPPHNSEVSTNFDLAYWMDYAAKAYRYDPEEAKRLLQQAGYADGFSIKLWTFPVGEAPYITKVAEVVQGYWMKIGVKAEISRTDDGSFRPIRNSLKSPVLIGAASTYIYSAASNTVKNLVHAYHTTLGSYTLVGKAMPEFDELLTSMMTEMNPTKRQELIKQGLQKAFDSWTILMISRTSRMVATGPRVYIEFPKPPNSLTAHADIAKHGR